MSDVELQAKLLGSLSAFTKAFYKIRTGRDFEISIPVARVSHHILIFKALTRVLRGETKRLIINVPPRYGKTEIIINFIAWATARYADAVHMYVSYSSTLATRQTYAIRETMQLAAYKRLFNVAIRDDSSAKGDFSTTAGGSVYAAGAGGTVTGMGAGIKNCARYGGAIIIDDIHKPDEANSDTIREGVIEWYYNTLQSRLNSKDTPIVFIGQRVHEADLAAHLIGQGGWEVLSLPALDENDNALYPEYQDAQTLLRMQQNSSYTFAAQYQQNPIPAGGGLYKKDDFVLLVDEPDILKTFITCDTAETSKQYNDASVFSFFGIYKISVAGSDTSTYSLHCIDCREVRVEPRDLESEFLAFYASCMRHKVKPEFAAIEKKSTGVTLASILKNSRGLKILDVNRNKSSGSKSDRFIEMQSFIAKKLISFTEGAQHVRMCIEHMTKITANDSHRHDDIADTFYDAVKIALIDEALNYRLDDKSERTNVLSKMRSNYLSEISAAKSARYR